MKTGYFEVKQDFVGLEKNPSIHNVRTRPAKSVICLPKPHISQHDMNSKIIITLFSLFAELERDMISIRTKEALHAKKVQGVILGKPKGTIQKSKFDKDIEKIKELLDYGLSGRKIAKVLGYTSHIALNTYIKKRNLRTQKDS
jgi:DNA invertase Pin-like site-specific DNA recombinase